MQMQIIDGLFTALLKWYPFKYFVSMNLMIIWMAAIILCVNCSYSTCLETKKDDVTSSNLSDWMELSAREATTIQEMKKNPHLTDAQMSVAALESVSAECMACAGNVITPFRARRLPLDGKVLWTIMEICHYYVNLWSSFSMISHWA